MSEVDRFLEEINRRRREMQQQESAQRARQPQQSRGAGAKRGAEARPKRPSVMRGPQQAPEVVPAQTPVEVVAVELPASPPTPAPPPAPEAPILGAPGGATTARRQDTPLAQVHALLRSRQGLRAVFMLQEILGPPLCRRPRSP